MDLVRRISGRGLGLRPGGLISEQLSERLTGFVLARKGAGGRDKLPAGQFEILAIVGQVLLSHRIGAAVPALLRHARVIADAV